MLRAFGAITIVSMDDRFGVAVGVKGVAKFFQLLPQLEIVVDLAVEDYPRCLILIMNRLLTAFEIDDRETAHSQSHRTANVKAVFVGTAMPYRRAHSRQQHFIDRSCVVMDYSYDSTYTTMGLLGLELLDFVYYDSRNAVCPGLRSSAVRRARARAAWRFVNSCLAS